MDQTDQHGISAGLSQLLFAAGFDVLGSVRVGAYNASLAQEHAAYRLPTLGSDDNVVILIGNTRRLWARFIEDYQRTALADEAHPLDAYTRLYVEPAVRTFADRRKLRYALRFSFDAAPNTVAIQRLAVLTGAAELAPIGLCVHPQHGPWLSLRAAAVLSIPGPPASTTQPPTCSACSERPCVRVGQPVLSAFQAQDAARIAQLNWRDWLAMRDACPVGRAARYSNQQICYHYTKQLTVLRE